MDYKELIDKLREKDGCHCECIQASDAIETLLAERDAAVEYLSHGGSRCGCCAYNYHSIHDYPCKHCKETGGMSDYWEWSGLKKDGG